MAAFKPEQPALPVKTKNVELAPAPRSVTLLRPAKSTPAERLYVPPFRKTTWFAGQLARAELIWAAVAPGFNVAQILVRLGTPPGMPTFDQLIARLGSMIPDHCCARTASGVTESNIKQVRSLFMRRIYI